MCVVEIVCKFFDEVIEVIWEVGFFFFMVLKCYGGYEVDLDIFFEVLFIFLCVDVFMGWLVLFYLEYVFWFCGFFEEF